MKSLLTFVVLLACLLITVTAACAGNRMQRYDGVETESPYWDGDRMVHRIHHRHHRHHSADYHRYCCKHGRAYYKSERAYGYESPRYGYEPRASYVSEYIYDEPVSSRRFWDAQDRDHF